MLIITERNRQKFCNEQININNCLLDTSLPKIDELNKIALRLEHLKSKTSLLKNVELSEYAKAKLDSM